MSRSIISKNTLKALQEKAPEGYEVKEKIFNIDVYPAEECDVLFEKLYLTKKEDDVAYLKKMIAGMSAYTQEDLGVFEDELPINVAEKLIDSHKAAALVLMDGERVYVHYK